MRLTSPPDRIEWLLRTGDSERPVPVSKRIVMDDEAWRATIERLDISDGLRVFLTTADVRQGLTLEPHHTEPAPWLVSDIAVKGLVRLTLSDGGEAHISPERSVLFRPADKRAQFTLSPRQELVVAGYMLRADRVERMFDGAVPEAIRLLIAPDATRSPLIGLKSTATIRRLAASMFSSGLAGALRAIFLEGVVVQLFALQSDAEEAEPHHASGSAPVGRAKAAIVEARERLLADMRAPPTLGDLADAAGMSEKTLNTGFRALFGATIFETLRNERLEHARLALEAGDLPMKVIAERVGFRHVTNFISAFTQRYGESPGLYRRGRASPADQPATRRKRQSGVETEAS
jgi:AraC-like DNA-binding protein